MVMLSREFELLHQVTARLKDVVSRLCLSFVDHVKSHREYFGRRLDTILFRSNLTKQHTQVHRCEGVESWTVRQESVGRDGSLAQHEGPHHALKPALVDIDGKHWPMRKQWIEIGRAH